MNQLDYQRDVIKNEYITDQDVSRRIAELKEKSAINKRGGKHGKSQHQFRRK